MSVFGIIIIFAFTGNIVFVQCLGWCPVLNVPKKTSAAIGSACAVAFVMTCSTLVAKLLDRFVLAGPVLSSFRIMAFVLTVTGIVLLTENGVRLLWPTLHRVMGASIPVLSANCAILGAVFLSLRPGFSVAESVLAGFSSGAGYLLALLLLSAVRDRVEQENVPKALRGAPIAFIAAGLLALDVALLSRLF